MYFDNTDIENPGQEEFDVMIFKVKEKVNRPEAKINAGYGVSMGEKLTAWTVNPDHESQGINGLIDKKNCTSYNHNNKLDWISLESVNFSENSTYLATHIDKCDKPMMKGNSGSTFFNSKNEGVMIFSHIYVDNKNESQSSRGYGTNYKCLGDVVDDEKTIFSRQKDVSCIAYGQKDIQKFRKNIEIDKHNQVVRVVKEINEKIKSVYLEAKGMRRKGINEDIASSLSYLVSESSHPGVKFDKWTWVRTLGDYKKPAPFIFEPSLPFYEEEISGAINGFIYLNNSSSESPEGLTDTWSNAQLNDFSTFEIPVPGCVSMDLEKMTRDRTDNKLNPFGQRTYSYRPVSVEIPISYIYKLGYSLSPDKISKRSHIDRIGLSVTSIDKIKLPFKIFIEVSSGGKFGNITFEPKQSFKEGSIAMLIKNYFDNKTSSLESIQFKKQCDF